MVANPRYSSGLVEIERDWTVVDVHDANALLDAFDDAEARAREKP